MAENSYRTSVLLSRIAEDFGKQWEDKWSEFNYIPEGCVEHSEFGGLQTHCRSTMYTLCKIVKPTTILEIGSWRYYCSFIMSKWMDDNNVDGSVHSFDIVQGGYDRGECLTHPKIKPMFWYPHHTTYDTWKYQSSIVYPEFQRMTNDEIFSKNAKILTDIAPKDGYDIVLIDGDHSYQGAKFDWEYAKLVSRPDTLICIDDLYDDRHWQVRKFFNDLTTPKFDFYDWNKNNPDKFTSMGVTCLS